MSQQPKVTLISAETAQLGVKAPPVARVAKSEPLQASKLVVPIIVGTRPEAIKLVPIIRRLAESDHYEPLVVSTGQHQRMVGLHLRAGRHQARRGAVGGLEAFATERAGGIGDAAVRGFLRRAVRGAPGRHGRPRGHPQRPVPGSGACPRRHHLGHVGCTLGLPPAHPRDARRGRPAHRGQQPDAVSRGAQPPADLVHRRLCTSHRPPRTSRTWSARTFPIEQIFVTGNTGIDALQWASTLDVTFVESRSAGAATTATAGSSWSPPTGARTGATGCPESPRACASCRSRTRGDFVLPLHPNPGVREALRAAARDLDNVLLTEPLEVCRRSPGCWPAATW